MGVNYRLATIRDAARIAEILSHNESLARKPSVDRILGIIRKSTVDYIIVAETDGGIVGVSRARKLNYALGEVRWVYVKPEYFQFYVLDSMVCDGG